MGCKGEREGGKSIEKRDEAFAQSLERLFILPEMSYNSFTHPLLSHRCVYSSQVDFVQKYRSTANPPPLCSLLMQRIRLPLCRGHRLVHRKCMYVPSAQLTRSSFISVPGGELPSCIDSARSFSIHFLGVKKNERSRHRFSRNSHHVIVVPLSLSLHSRTRRCRRP